jgi:hypothetical protein
VGAWGEVARAAGGALRGGETRFEDSAGASWCSRKYFVVLTLKEAGLTAITVVGPVAKTLILSASRATVPRGGVRWIGQRQYEFLQRLN